ncbi:MAG TPA: hypothetical protein VML19_08345 [Verrucomicrobiae bacterium]|nr:hypothetical protein [Verrucomicrobiae bacterium]
MMNDDPAARSEAETLLERFLNCPGYNRQFSRELIAAGKSPGVERWEVRCLAALLLESQFLRIPAANIAEQQRIAREAGASDDETAIRALRRRFQRQKHLHRRISRPRTASEALPDCLHIAAQPCRLWFARCFLRPEEVADRILAGLRVSRGVSVGLPEGGEWPQAAREWLAALPEYEQRIVTALFGEGRVYWAAPSTPGRINSLFEYPPGTVVLVIKPPGSDLEFEIKRVGFRGPNVLSALFARETPVPWPHRLQGGSVGCMIDNEARATLRIVRLYRALHGIEPPVSFVMDMTTVYSVPARTGDTDLLSYFTESGKYGDGFAVMRAAMAQCVQDFEKGKPDVNLPGALGVTVQFLRHLAPKQALLSGTSSFRLDRLARYLSPAGPDLYFREGLECEYSPGDARRLADDLLIEVLGVYTPPAIRYEGYEEYVGAALQVPANRRRADRTYIDLMRQIGRFWGTLVGLGAYSRGETFVARNAGLRSLWIDGRWSVRLCFLDHDSTWMPWEECGELDAQAMLHGTQLDARYILNETFTLASAPGEIGCLRQIYRPGPRAIATASRVLVDTVRRYARKTRAGLKSQEAARLIDSVFLRSKAEWEGLVRRWLREDGRNDAVSPEWAERAAAELTAQGYDAARTAKHLDVLQKECQFLRKFDFLYDSGYRDFRRSKGQSAG